MSTTRSSDTGIVYLVGAGPGDPDLITIKGLTLLESADVIMYDRLIDSQLLSKAKPDAKLINVGKNYGTQHFSQSKINTQLVDLARKGKTVVRLKGGDPFVFGRGSEEAEILAENGVPFEVVPGITSAIAAPMYAGIPVTHRDYSSTLTVITGSESADKLYSNISWADVANGTGTLVILMGWRNLNTILDQLVHAGLDPETPTAVVRCATAPNQKTVSGTVSNIIQRAHDSNFSAPVVVVIGKVVELRKKIKWFENKPLFGKRVLITRSKTQVGSLSRLVSKYGAIPIEIPSIEIENLEDYTSLDMALSQLFKYSWIIFTSTNTVEAVFDRLRLMGKDSRELHGVKVAAIGSSTAKKLKQLGISADFVPSQFVSESIAEGLGNLEFLGKTVLLPKADIASTTLRTQLENLGCSVEEVDAYRTKPSTNGRTLLENALLHGIDIITFTSSSTVTNVISMLRGRIEQLARTKIACIGPVTSQSAKDAGLTVHIEAEEHTIEGLVDSLKSYYNE